MKPMNIASLIVFGIHTSSLCAWADLNSRIPQSINLFSSPQGGWVGSTSAEPPVAVFSDFPEEAVGKFFTIATGPEFTNLFSRSSASFSGVLFDDRCKIVDAPRPFVLRSFDVKKSEYEKQSRQLSTCLRMRVRDAARIRPAENQQLCTIHPINNNEVLASGGLCFFQVSQESGFSVSYEVNPDCADAEKFNDLGLEPLDIFAKGAFFLSGDATGRSRSLASLGWTSLRFSIEAPEDRVALSTNMGQGTPRWPVRPFTDFHMGQIAVEQRDNNASLVTFLFAENVCQNEGSIECRFAVPLGMRFSLRELDSRGESRLLEQWYAGGVAPAKWQGFVPAERRLTFQDFRPGRRYRLEADLTYLSLYYQLFKEGFRDFLVSLGLMSIDPSQPLRPLPPIALLPAIGSLKPQLPLPTVHPLSPGGGEDLVLELNRLRALLTGVDWPPFYERMCGESGCVRALEGQAKMVVGVDFNIDEFVDGRAKLSGLKVWRQSAYLPEYSLNVSSLMRPDCQ